MKELENIIRKYFQKEGSGIVYYNIDQETFNKVIDPQNIGSYERPDILSMFENKIIGIEHFEFDSFKRNRKGSDFKIKEYQVEKKFEEKMEKVLRRKDSIIVHDQIESSSTMENYFNNFKKVFLEHYNKIDSYIKHINEDFDCSNKEIHICFFAEDVSPLGSYFLDEKRKINLLNPLFSDEIIEVLNNCQKVEYLIIGTYVLNGYKMIIIENKKEVLERLKKEHQKIEEKDFFSFEPQTTGYAIKISKEKIIKNE